MQVGRRLLSQRCAEVREACVGGSWQDLAEEDDDDDESKGEGAMSETKMMDTDDDDNQQQQLCSGLNGFHGQVQDEEDDDDDERVLQVGGGMLSCSQLACHSLATGEADVARCVAVAGAAEPYDKPDETRRPLRQDHHEGVRRREAQEAEEQDGQRRGAGLAQRSHVGEWRAEEEAREAGSGGVTAAGGCQR